MKLRALIATASALALACAIALAGVPEEAMPQHGSDAVLLGDSGIVAPTGPVAPVRKGAAPDVSKEHWTVPTESDAMAMDLLGLQEDGRFHADGFVTKGELTAVAARFVRKAQQEWPGRSRIPGEAGRESFLEGDGEYTTRADLARVLTGILCNLEPAATRLAGAMDAATEIFYDVPEGDPRFEVIVAARDLGLVRGYHDGGYHPQEPVLRMELAESLIWAWRYLSTLPDPAPSMVAPDPSLNLGADSQPAEEPEGAESEIERPEAPREHWTTDPAADTPDPMGDDSGGHDNPIPPVESDSTPPATSPGPTSAPGAAG